MYIKRCIYIIALLGLTACGGGGGESASENKPIDAAPETPIEISPETPSAQVFDLTGQSGLSLAAPQKVAGTQSESNSVVSTSFSNAIGSLRYANTNSNVEGNLTFGITASDADVMNKVSLYLPNAARSFVLCSDNCTPDFQATITGFNPQLADEVAGSLRIELIVEDSLGNSAVVDAISVNWQPIQISALSASREGGIVNVSWAGNSSLQRYNLYAATDVGITSENVTDLDNGVQKLAINGTTAQFDDANESKNYHLLVTGIDTGGESGESVPFSLPRLGGIANLPPVANNDNYQVNEDETITVNVLDNDFDPEGLPLAIDSILLLPVNGTLTYDDAGNITYGARTNFHGNDSASYRVIDAEGAMSEATVFFEILPVNDNPIAVADTYGVDVSGNINAANTNLLSNDSDIDGDDLTIITTPITAPQLGSLSINADGSFSYQSSGVLTQNDQFVYQVSDNKGGTATATVTILPNGSVLPPIAINDNYTVSEDSTLVISSINLGILANDSDPNDLPFELQKPLLIEPQHGQLNLALDGTFTYIPNSNFFGVDQFQYQIKNSADFVTEAFVTITINATADAPIALDDNYQTQEDIELVVNAANGLLINDVDFDDSTLKVNTTPINSPQNGNVVLAEDGGFSYLPNQNFNGIDSFTYQVISGTGLSNTANVNISVVPLNDAPIAANDTATTNEDTQITVNVLANDTDSDGDTLSLISVSLENGIADIVNEKLVITPALNYFGEITAIYTITDRINAPETGTLVLTVLPVNDAPIALDDSYSLVEDAVLNILVTADNNPLKNDADVDGDMLTASLLSTTTNGSLILNSNGAFSYTPSLNFNGTDNFTYQVSDGNGGKDNASVEITVTPNQNNAPVAIDDSYSFNEDFTWVRLVTDGDQLLSNDYDVDGDVLTVNTTPISAVSNGALTLNADGSFTYVPNADFFGQDSFIYEISDGRDGTAQAAVTLIVHAINDIPVIESNTKSFTFDEDTVVSKSAVDADNLLGGASDVDGDTLTVVLTSDDTLNGNLSFNADGAFSYSPDANFFGVETFSYRVTDNITPSEVITVELNIQAVNDAPVSADAPYIFSITELASNGDAVGTINALDIEGDSIVYTLTSGDISLFEIDSSTGAITVKGTLPFDFETNQTHNLTATITDDGSPLIASANVDITINITDEAGESSIEEASDFGRTAFGALELTGKKTQAQLTDSVRDGSRVYFVGSIDNVDKDIYMVAYDDDGTLDNGFGNNGTKTFDYGANEYAKAIVNIDNDYFVIFERNENNVTEVCFIKVDNDGDIDDSFGDNGLRCTGEQKTLTINDAVAYLIPATQGDDTTEIETIVAVGKVKGATDDDLLVIRVDKNGNFQTSTTIVSGVEVVYSPHIMLDITGNNLDDEGIAVYNPHDNEAMIAGNVLSADGDYDIFAWIFNPKNADGNYATFNNSTPKVYDVGSIGKDDKVKAIDGENTGAGGHTAHIVGSTVLASDEQDAFIIELDSTAQYATGFGSNGIATYDVDGVFGSGISEFTDYVYNYEDDNLLLSGNLFDGSNYMPFATRIFLDGSVDTLNYGSNGYRLADYSGHNAYANSMSLDDDEGIWIAGYAEDGSDKDMAITVFDSSGDLLDDNDFDNGKNTLTHSSLYSDDSAAEILQIQSGAQAGKYLIASIADDGTNQHIILTRLTSTGQLDTTFDSDGNKQLKIGTSAKVNGMFELTSGNLIVYGDVTEEDSANGFIARIDQNGVLDVTFASNGIYKTTDISANNIHFNQAKQDALGNIIAVGSFESGSINAFVLRLTNTGALDTLFNSLDTQGYVIGANTDNYTAVAIDSSNNIYAGGNRELGDKDFLMVKYSVAGIQGVVASIDPNPGLDDSVEKIIFDSNNDLYLVGNEDRSLSRVVIVKTNTSGTLDTSFSGDGIAYFKMSSGLEPEYAIVVSDAVIDSNDNIVVVGSSSINLAKRTKMLGRIKPDGNLDSDFDSTGYYRSSNCANNANLESIVLLNNSSFVVAGQCYQNVISLRDLHISHFTMN